MRQCQVMSNRSVVGLATLFVVSLLAGCGSSRHPSVAQLQTTTTSTTATGSARSGATGSALSQAIAFAACMRSHGEPDYPDPTIGRDGEPVEHFSSSSNPSLNPNTPHFRAAEGTCLAKQPPESPVLKQATAAKQRQELKFAACMRAQGEPNFPDPKMMPDGFMLQLPPHMDPNSPQFLAAERTCTKLGDGPASFGP